MATFYNRATLSYNGRLTNSNVTEGELLDSLSITKTALNETYSQGGTVLYAVSITNSGTSAEPAFSFTDDLGAYTVGTSTVYPLEYVDGSLRLYIGGVPAALPTVTQGPPLTVSDINIPAGSNALVLYEARVTEFAPIADGSVITNTVTANSGCVENLSAEASITVESAPRLSIAKAICPGAVSCAGELTYTFVIQNTGNAPVVATDDLVVSDTFIPILNDITVTYNGEPFSEGVNYSYSETTGEFSTLPGQITVPAASYTQDSETGVITLTPGVATITVTGTV